MDSRTITRQQLCGMFDHTCLKPFADRSMFEGLCREAKQGNFAMVAVNPAPVVLCKEFLRGTQVHVGAAVSFPLGQMTIKDKEFEAENAIQNGADEIDYVINIGAVKDADFSLIREEMERMTAVCRNADAICKVIFENCYLTEDEIRKLAEIAREVKPDFIKTSTGFGTYGARAEDVRLMKETVGDTVKVKAAGGIRSWEVCRQMIDAGAQRIGTSSSLKILEEYERERAMNKGDGAGI